MITIIHGDDIVSSRNYLQEEKQKKKDSVSFDASKITIPDLAQNIQGSGLFSSTKTIFVEDFISRFKKTNKDAKGVMDFIIKNNKTCNIFLYEAKEIPKTGLFAFRGAVVKLFKLPQNIFIFLDNIKPGNPKNLIYLFHKTLEAGVKEELIFFMIQRQIRLLLALTQGWNNNGTIDEIVRLSPWQKAKIERQGRLFAQDQLKRIHSLLYKIELGLKTGKLNLTLPQAIDFLLLEI
ncbi:MAG: hypothetical protein AAB583_00375 [Patescibacteria group bacterium]